MKKYFCKFLPVEGDSDFVQCWGKAICKRSPSNSALYHLIDNPEGEGPVTDWEVKTIPDGFKHVKLFLCSRDLKIGDKIDCSYSLEDGASFRKIGEVIPDEYPNVAFTLKTVDNFYESGFGKEFIPKEYAFKVIGEISPEAIWVTENMEFSEEDLQVVYKDWRYSQRGSYIPFVVPLPTHHHPWWRVAIKGPCGHFH